MQLCNNYDEFKSFANDLAARISADSRGKYKCNANKLSDMITKALPLEDEHFNINTLKARLDNEHIPSFKERADALEANLTKLGFVNYSLTDEQYKHFDIDAVCTPETPTKEMVSLDATVIIDFDQEDISIMIGYIDGDGIQEAFSINEGENPIEAFEKKTLALSHTNTTCQWGARFLELTLLYPRAHEDLKEKIKRVEGFF